MHAVHWLESRPFRSLMQCLLCFRLYRILKRIQHIHTLVHPPALVMGVQIYLIEHRSNPSAPSPTASFGTFIPRTFRSSNTSRQLCVDSRSPSSIVKTSSRLDHLRRSPPANTTLPPRYANRVGVS